MLIIFCRKEIEKGMQVERTVEMHSWLDGFDESRLGSLPTSMKPDFQVQTSLSNPFTV